SMRNLKLIIGREFRARVRNRTFMVMTFLSPLILVGMITLIAYLSSLNSDQVRIVGINDQTGMFISEFYDTEAVDFQDLSQLSLEEAQGLVREKEYFGLLYIPKRMELHEGQVQFYAKEAPTFGFLEQIEKTIAEKLTDQELESRGMDLSTIEAARQTVNIEI